MKRTRFFNQNPRIRSVLLSGMAAAYRARGLTSTGLGRNRVQFLMLHEVLESEEKIFRTVIQRLQRRHRFIGYSEAVDRILDGRIDRPYLALSFDDGFASCRRTAALLKTLSIPACFFVCPSIIGEKDSRKIQDFCHNRLNEKWVRPFLDWSDVEAMLQQGHEIGGHTMTHADLAKCPESELRAETEECFSTLLRACGRVRHFAWPFGHFGHVSPAAVRSVFEAGFNTCASSERGCHTSRAAGGFRALCIRRDFLVPRTPLAEIEYFLAHNSNRSSADRNGWPFDPSAAPLFAPNVASTV